MRTQRAVHGKSDVVLAFVSQLGCVSVELAVDDGKLLKRKDETANPPSEESAKEAAIPHLDCQARCLHHEWHECQLDVLCLSHRRQLLPKLHQRCHLDLVRIDKVRNKICLPWPLSGSKTRSHVIMVINIATTNTPQSSVSPWRGELLESAL
jgi:hypothetical protein